MDALTLYRISHKFYKLSVPLLPNFLQGLTFLLFNSYIPYDVKIGNGTKIGHRGIGVVINRKCTIGKNCLLRAHITLGGGGPKEGCPILHDGVQVGDGARVLGGVTIGNNAMIGANAVVLQDVPAYATAVGVPARIIPKKLS